MRALQIAATGMSAQQMRVEVISNNIANMNTVGFKRQRAEFQDLLYQTIERAGAQRGGGFVDFVFPKPGAGDVFKLGYAEAIGGTPFWIGTGVYIDNVDKAESHLITTMRSLLHSKLAAYGFGFLAILLLVVCPLSYVMVVSITRPLAGITRHARAVAQGKGTKRSIEQAAAAALLKDLGA